MIDLPGLRAALGDRALLRDGDELATLVVTGADRLSWLNGLVTCNLKPLAPGDAAYGLSVGKTGRIVSDLWIALSADALYLAVEATQLEPLQTLFEQHLIMEDAEIAQAPTLRWTFAYGRRAADVAERARSAGPGVRAAARGVHGDLPVALVCGDETTLAELKGHAVAQLGALSASEPGWTRLRIEHVLPRFGVDFEAVYPQEASLERMAVAFDKGCYLGQEAVFMLEKRGQSSRRLVLLSVDGSEELAVPAVVTDREGHDVGAATSASAADSPVLALATVRRTAARTATELSVGRRLARVLRGLDS